MSKKYRTYTKEFKLEALELLRTKLAGKRGSRLNAIWGSAKAVAQVGVTATRSKPRTYGEPGTEIDLRRRRRDRAAAAGQLAVVRAGAGSS